MVNPETLTSPVLTTRRALFVFGTRPEAIKLSPLILKMREISYTWKPVVCVTGQHRELLHTVLELFGVRPDYDLDVMTPGQTLSRATSQIIARLEPVIAASAPDLVFVQGDTASTFCAALAAFYARVPVVHVEAGLRTGNMAEPFPEELNRVLTSRIATLHCAATQDAVDNLLREGVPASSIRLTGNTGIDALHRILAGIEDGSIPVGRHLPPLDGSRLILVTAHRRENFGEPLRRVCEALRILAERQDVTIVYPVHPNPEVRSTVHRMLDGKSRVTLLQPLSYQDFVYLLSRAWMVITDSGGIQEEAPSLGKPVLVLRDCTERPEAVSAGTAVLTGTTTEAIVANAARLLDDRTAYDAMARGGSLYGDGRATERILQALEDCS